MKLDSKAPVPNEHNVAEVLKYHFEQSQVFHKATILAVERLRVSTSTPFIFLSSHEVKRLERRELATVRSMNN